MYKRIHFMEALIILIKNFCAGAACGGLAAFVWTFLHNVYTFKKENKIPVDQILKWVIIGILLGGFIIAALFS